MKSAHARLQIKNLGTSMDSLDRAVMDTNRTIPLPTTANRNTIQTPQRRDHQPNRSSQGRNGPNTTQQDILIYFFYCYDTLIARIHIIVIYSSKSQQFEQLTKMRVYCYNVLTFLLMKKRVVLHIILYI